MGKKNKKKTVSASGKPFVSVCTPTYNRRQFVPTLIKCFEAQTYPKELVEWIIIDDGTDKVADLFEGMERVKYFYYPDKMKLGKKRNLMHEKCKGEIIIYFLRPKDITHLIIKKPYLPPNLLSYLILMELP